MIIGFHTVSIVDVQVHFQQVVVVCTDQGELCGLSGSESVICSSVFCPLVFILRFVIITVMYFTSLLPLSVVVLVGD